MTETALDQLRADRAAQAAGATGLSTLFGEQLGIAKGQTAADIARAQLAAGVGAERRELARESIGAEREVFQERDPFSRAQQYLATISGAPTRQEQFYQPKSTLQEAAGLASIFMGAAAGGQLNQAKKIFDMAGMTKDEFDKLDADINEADKLNAIANMVSDKEKKENKVKSALAGLAQSDLRPQETDQQYFRKQAAAQSKLKQMINQPKTAYRQVGSSVSPTDAMRAGLQGRVATGINRPTKEEARRQAAERLRAQEAKAAQTEDMDSPPASVRAMDRELVRRRDAEQQQQQQQEKQGSSLMDRILGGVRSGLQSISSANLDPFKGYTDKERVRIGLGILGAMPEIGEGPLGPIGRGALLAIEELPEAEVITPRVAPVPSSEYAVIDEGILGLQKTKTKMGAERRNQLRRESEQEVIQAIRAGQVANDPASFRTAVLANYERKVRAETGVRSSDAGDSSTVVAPSGKGSASAGIDAAGKNR